MGLDVYMMKGKSTNSDDVGYWRRSWGVVHAVSHVIDTVIENGQVYTLHKRTLLDVIRRALVLYRDGEYDSGISDFPEDMKELCKVLEYMVDNDKEYIYFMISY